MKLKISILTFVFFSLFITANAFKPMNNSNPSTFEKIKASKGNDLLNMIPNEFPKLRGKKLTLKEIIQLKVAKKVLKAKMHKKIGEGNSLFRILIALLVLSLVITLIFSLVRFVKYNLI
jgi:hypothetical protein